MLRTVLYANCDEPLIMTIVTAIQKFCSSKGISGISIEPVQGKNRQKDFFALLGQNPIILAVVDIGLATAGEETCKSATIVNCLKTAGIPTIFICDGAEDKAEIRRQPQAESTEEKFNAIGISRIETSDAVRIIAEFLETVPHLWEPVQV